MTTYTKKHIERIKTVFETSPVWKEINNKVKDMYTHHGRRPSDEEYQAVRMMILCKTAIEDRKVMKVLSDCTWEALNQIE